MELFYGHLKGRGLGDQYPEKVCLYKHMVHEKIIR